ncbi:C4b-binding protein beta chain [Pleurodeles waltl]|uniref:C4b-binding protein beta chain n=1 Tax=Pleurodeles waltl TaxID=8319 RepID=UPI00370965BF
MEYWKLVFFLFFQCFSVSQGCDEVPSVENADWMIKSDESGTRVTYRCRKGSLIGYSVLSCNASRQWDAPPPLCKEQNGRFLMAEDGFPPTVFPGRPEDKRNGKIETKSGCPNLDLLNGEVTSGLKTQYFPGDKAMFQCYPHFLLEGSRTITCTQAETWVPEPPKCIKKEFTYCGVELEDWKPALEQEKLCLEVKKAELERMIKAV